MACAPAGIFERVEDKFTALKKRIIRNPSIKPGEAACGKPNVKITAGEGRAHAMSARYRPNAIAKFTVESQKRRPGQAFATLGTLMSFRKKRESFVRQACPVARTGNTSAGVVFYVHGILIVKTNWLPASCEGASEFHPPLSLHKYMLSSNMPYTLNKVFFQRRTKFNYITKN